MPENMIRALPLEPRFAYRHIKDLNPAQRN